MSRLDCRLEDLRDEFLAFWARAEGSGRPRQRELWQRFYERPHQELFDLYFGGWGKREDLGGALERFGEVVQILPGRGERLRELIEQFANPLASAFEAGGVALSLVAFVGLFRSNAWVTDYRGEPTAFFALESFPEQQPHDAVLVAHEMTHQLHERLRQGRWDECNVAQCLFSEGLATVASESLVPGRSLAEYLWFEDGYEDWLAACEAVWATSCQVLLGDLGGSRETRDRFFLMRPSEAGDVPPRAGYFIAEQVVKKFLGEHGLAELARWPAERVESSVREALLTSRDG